MDLLNSKAHMMEFILKLDGVLEKWPRNEKWDFKKIAFHCQKPRDHIVDMFSNAVGSELDLNAHLSRDEVIKISLVFKERMKPHLLARQRKIQAQRDQALKAYEMTMEKVRKLQMSKNWSVAYRTLTNFVGSYESDLGREVLLSCLNDCMRLALKSGENLQEQGRWLRKAIQIETKEPTRESIEDAIDLLDAYTEALKNEPSGNGEKLLKSLIQSLQVPAAQFNLVNEYTTLLKELNPDKNYFI